MGTCHHSNYTSDTYTTPPKMAKCEKLTDDDCTSKRGWGNFHLIIGTFLSLLSANGFAGTHSVVWKTLTAADQTAVIFSILGVVFAQLAIFYMGFEMRTSLINVIFIGLAFASQLIYMSVYTAQEKAGGIPSSHWFFGSGWGGCGNLLAALVYKVLGLMGKIPA